MNNSIKKLAALISACIMLTACDNDFSSPVGDTSSYSSGTADLSNFVSIGDSLTAGYADSALYKMGQESSYPAILAQQFALVGGGSFRQPLMDDNLGGLLIGGSPLSGFDNRLVMDGASRSPEPIAGTATTELHPALNQNPLSGSFNNMGVPGTKSFHLVKSGYGDLAGIFDVNTSQPVSPPTANPYFIRFASSSTTSMIADAAAQQPSFFILWIGNNDVLSYATSGGDGTNQLGNTDPSSYGSDDITDPTVFAGVYNQLVGAFITANADAQGVLINIPDVKSIPFFTTVPYNPIPLDQSDVTALTNGFSTYNAGLEAALAGGAAALGLTQEEVDRRKIEFTVGEHNAPVILDEDLTDLTSVNAALINLRQATADDLIVLKARTIIGKENTSSTDRWGLSATSALRDQDVLIPSEIAAIETATTAFNAAIKAAADANPNLILYDAAADLAELKASGIDYGTGLITAVYGTGGGFSLDGVHPTARGYAVVANGIIDSINEGFSANIPHVDPGAYTTIFVK